MRLVSLERWNLACIRGTVVESTGLLHKIEIVKHKHNANKQELEVTFHVHLKDTSPAECAEPTAEEVTNFFNNSIQFFK